MAATDDPIPFIQLNSKEGVEMELFGRRQLHHKEPEYSVTSIAEQVRYARGAVYHSISFHFLRFLPDLDDSPALKDIDGHLPA